MKKTYWVCFAMVGSLLFATESILAKPGSPWVRTNDTTYATDQYYDHISGEPFVDEQVSSNEFVNQSCTDDWALNFDISGFGNIQDFDVDNLYITSVTVDGDNVLNELLQQHKLKNGLTELALKPLQWNHWDGSEDISGTKLVSYCVGDTITHNLVGGIPIPFSIKESVRDALKDLRMVYVDGSNSDPQIFTQGNHTHVIANDYRCSKETNGPILCWESGLDPNEADGRRNCWNAWNWYQFNGEVSQVADHHNDSGWITNLSRDFTCNQVYNSGTNISTGGDLGGTSYGTGNGTGSGYHNDSGDPWAGYVHHVGLQYLKIGKKSSGHWKGSKVWALSQIPTKRDFRVKLKRKGDKWTNVCAEIWFSHNKYFTDDDLYLGKECKKLSKKKYRKKKKKS